MVAHTVYRQRGGEEAVAESEVRLLGSAGCSVSTVFPKSADFDGLDRSSRLRIGVNAGDHEHGRALVRRAFDKHGIPDVVHFHNLFPMLGYGAVDEADLRGCATVVTLHNYRLSCLAGTHRCDDAHCERCSPGRYWPGISRACYRGSRLQSAALARGLTRYWNGLRDSNSRTVVLCLTEFMREWFTSFGLPTERVLVKPNSIGDFGRVSNASERSGAVFVGRLAPEKGALGLVRHWPPGAPTLTVAGSGPELEAVSHEAGSNVRIVDAVPVETVRDILASARVLMFPSLSFEGLPLVILEALAAGTPCAAFDVRSTRSIFGQSSLGFLCTPGDFGQVATAGWVACVEPDDAWLSRSEAARARYEDTYTDARNVTNLIESYDLAIRLRRG